LTWLAAASSSSFSEPIGLVGALALALGSLVLALNSRGGSSSDGRSVGAEASAEPSATSDAAQLRADVARLTAEAAALKEQLRAWTTPADAAAATLGSLAAASPSPRPRSRDAEALRLGVAVARLEAQLAVAQAAREDADAALATYRCTGDAAARLWLERCPPPRASRCLLAYGFSLVLWNVTRPCACRC
jgi:hypothetical protein